MAPNLLNQALNGVKGAASAKEVQANVLKAHGNVLEFNDTVYQISNMSAVEIVSFSAAFPSSAVLGLLFALSLITVGYPVRYMGFFIGIWSLVSLFRWLMKRQEYGLLLLLNAGAGASTVIRSHDYNFLRGVLHALRDIMNGNTRTGMIAYFDQRKVSNFKNIKNLNYNGGDVPGNLHQNIGHAGSETTPPLGTSTNTDPSKD